MKKSFKKTFVTILEILILMKKIRIAWIALKRNWFFLWEISANKFLKRKLKKGFMARFYGWSLSASRLQSHYEEAVYFLPLSSQKILVLTWLTSEGSKAESTLEPPSGFWTQHPWIGNPASQPLGHCSRKSGLQWLILEREDQL